MRRKPKIKEVTDVSSISTPSDALDLRKRKKVIIDRYGRVTIKNKKGNF